VIKRPLIASSRRAFLSLAALGIAGGGLWAALRVGRARSWLSSLGIQVSPADAALRPLSERTLHTLRTTVRAVIGHDVDLAAYEDYFAWRALHIPGAGARCEAFADTAEKLARDEHESSFAFCSEGTQSRVLARLFHEPEHRSVRDDILKRFARTEAWIAIGYDSYPGMPRGLDDYLKPLPGARGG